MDRSQHPTGKPANCLEETDIITRFQRGDEEAFEIIFRRCHAGVFYFAMQFVKDQPVAEDIVAGSFAELWQRKGEFECLAAIKSFLYATIKDACLDQLRLPGQIHICRGALKFDFEKLPGEEAGDHRIIKAELIQKICDDIEKWPLMRREIFRMTYLEGLNCFEAADILGTTVDSVRVQKARALHALRGIFKESP